MGSLSGSDVPCRTLEGHASAVLTVWTHDVVCAAPLTQLLDYSAVGCVQDGRSQNNQKRDFWESAWRSMTLPSPPCGRADCSAERPFLDLEFHRGRCGECGKHDRPIPLKDGRVLGSSLWYNSHRMVEGGGEVFCDSLNHG